MSLLRQRATDVSVESTLSALSPAAARLWLVSATSCFSEADEYAPSDQASVAAGAASVKTDVARNATAMSRALGRVPSRLARDMRNGSPLAGWGSGVVPTVGVRSAQVRGAKVRVQRFAWYRPVRAGLEGFVEV